MPEYKYTPDIYLYFYFLSKIGFILCSLRLTFGSKTSSEIQEQIMMGTRKKAKRAGRNRRRKGLVFFVEFSRRFKLFFVPNICPLVCEDGSKSVLKAHSFIFRLLNISLLNKSLLLQYVFIQTVFVWINISLAINLPLINALFTWALVTCPFTMLFHPDWVLLAFTALAPALARHGV